MNRITQAETANEKLKWVTQTHKADGMQAIPMLYITQLEAISHQQYVSWKMGRLWAPGPCTSPLRLWPRNMQHFKMKTVWYLQSLAPCEGFFIMSHFICNILYYVKLLVKSIPIWCNVLLKCGQLIGKLQSQGSYYFFSKIISKLVMSRVQWTVSFNQFEGTLMYFF